jgi:hypothetical protein
MNATKASTQLSWLEVLDLLDAAARPDDPIRLRGLIVPVARRFAPVATRSYSPGEGNSRSTSQVYATWKCFDKLAVVGFRPGPFTRFGPSRRRHRGRLPAPLRDGPLTTKFLVEPG